MQEALFYISTVLSIAALLMLLVKPLWGVMAIFIVRPLVDTTYSQSLVFDFRLTELVSAFVPIIILARILFLDDPRQRLFRDMPLKWDWVICSLDAVLFSALIMFQQDWKVGLSVLMRHLDGIAGFYMVQAYCRSERDFLHFCWALAVAGIFPMTTGLWEGLTGQHWSLTFGTNDVVRNIGMYHDAITIRCFAQQTLIALLVIVVLSKRSSLTVLFAVIYGVIAAYVLKGAYSKSGTLTFVVWVVLWPILRRSVKGSIALVAAALVSVVYFSKEIMDSVVFVFAHEIDLLQGHAEVENTFAGRWQIWEDMANEWNTYPFIQHVFGTGHIANGAHNDYLQVLFHGGYLGLGVYIILLIGIGWSIGRLMVQRIDLWAILALYVYIMWMVDTIGLVPSAYSVYQWFAWGIIGFCLRFRRDERQRLPETVVASPVGPRFPNLMGAT